MRFKVGDRVKIKSLDWYNENKDEYGYIDCGSRAFFTKMSDWCGKIATIKEICKTNCYRLEEYDFDWTDEMIEELVEEPITLNGKEVLLKLANIELPSGTTNIWECPEGYQFVDENGNVINATKIVLEKKKKEYPKTLRECCEMLDIDSGCLLASYDIGLWKDELLGSLQKLLICRDAYWKIYGEEMGLGKPWKPDWNDDTTHKFTIHTIRDKIYCGVSLVKNYTFAFPTTDLRDAFYENFKELIEQCKELL